jgi:hypothetical protein
MRGRMWLGTGGTGNILIALRCLTRKMRKLLDEVEGNFPSVKLGKDELAQSCRVSLSPASPKRDGRWGSASNGRCQRSIVCVMVGGN